MPIEKVKKRNGNIVDFDRDRIQTAVHKAFSAIHKEKQDESDVITNEVVRTLEASFPGASIPNVEDIQDVVEKKIAERGYFDVAKSYILYRKEHEQKREDEQHELLSKISARKISVTKRDGTKVAFDLTQVRAAIERYCGDDLKPSVIDQIISEALTNVYDGISTSEINQALIMSLRARIERDPLYSYLAARVLLNDLYRDIIRTDEADKNFEETYRRGLIDSLKLGIAAERLDKHLLDFNLKKLSAAIDVSRDRLFNYMSIETLRGRYLIRDLAQNILEVPQYFWMRVAMGLAMGEKAEVRDAKAIEFYNVLSSLRYVASTPTLFHSGTNHPQMSSCYLTTVEDDLDHIFKSIGDNAQLSKWSGGLGNDWTNIRATGAQIKSTNVGSQGVVPFLKISDATTAAINRSGKRRGATCVYLETWHYDIEDFLELRKNTGDERRRTHDTNTANWIPDLFMKRVLQGGEWTLFSPDETPELHHLYGRKFEEKYEAYEKMADEGKIRLWKRVPAAHMWRQMINMLFSTGHPWMTWKDASNIRSPQDHVGVVHSSNLCTEITLNTSRDETAVCNLGSINLVRHVRDGQVDKAMLAETTTTAMRMLDNVIDLNFYPTKEAKNSNMKHRPVGLGIMGWQDMLYDLGMQFDSEEAVELSDEIMEFISYHSIGASSQLAKEKGTYESYKGSKWDRNLFPIDTVDVLEAERGVKIEVDRTARMDWSPVRAHVKEYGMRNSNCMAIAPTATISTIAGCLPSIEPIYKNIYTKSNVTGEFTVVNHKLIVELKKLNLWNREMLEKIKHYEGSIQDIPEIPQRIKDRYKEVFEINWDWIIRHAAKRSKWIDQSQSLNLFIRTESGKSISDMYLAAWKAGLKTTYYLRTLAASGVEQSTIDINKKFAAPTA
ncbi:MAG: ribonucleoside-diphosphate reductase subunit alpha [Candidatus Andersenbacteria bacterium]|nr:ribonucleoside-diphosphate reductase subunit alpha [Candidatus Andersenbacteria bacterium]MBI3250419.1 ribonucleoside-diphosphate reductase subunit alpha [Candidatus Andersenbacteria bacterium]